MQISSNPTFPANTKTTHQDEVQQPLGDVLDGWDAIAARVTQRTGLDVSAAAAARLSKRRKDPLPVRKWGGVRPRVRAEARQVDAWCDRQWHAVTNLEAGGAAVVAAPEPENPHE